MNRTSRKSAWHVALVLLTGVLCALSTLALAAPTLTATPQIVTIPAGQTSGKTVLSWSAGADNPEAEVWLAVGNVVDEPFGERPSGKQQIVIEAGKTYTFNLYKDKDAQNALVTVVVTTKMAAGDADNADDGDNADGGVLAPAPDDDEAVPANGGAVSFAGTWKTVAGGGNVPFTVTIKQTGNKVTGSYSPGDGKIFDGVVVGRKVTFKWTQAPDWEGTSEWTMDEDGKGFIGSTTALKPKQFTHSWSTPHKPVSSFAGKWSTLAGGTTNFIVSLEQTGNKVTGTHSPNNGKIEGTVTGKILRFTFSNTGGKGSGRFVMNEDNQSFSGGFNLGDDPDDVDGTWNGKRLVWFAGKWKAESNLATFTITLEQTGEQVKGSYTTNLTGVATTLQDVTLVDKTLRFKLADAAGKIIGDGEFVMDKDGKSFTGNIVGIQLTGALEDQ